MEASALLERLLELTELESRLIVAADADGMHRVIDERAELLAQLPTPLPASCRALAERFVALAAANEAAATAAADTLRRELSSVSSNRAAVTAYAPGPALVSMDREG